MGQENEEQAGAELKSGGAKSASAREAGKAGSAFMDLLPRVISGVVLAVAALALTYWGLLPFAFLILAVSLILCWEWGGVIRGEGFDLVFAIHAGAVGLAVGLAAFDLVGLGFLALAVGALAIIGVRFGDRSRLSAFGVFYVGLPALALLWFRADPSLGFAAVVFLFAVVWTTDVGAYAAGRTLGGPKLWPAVSPKKTWSGLIGGVLSAVALGTFCATMLAAADPLVAGVTALCLALISQAGDMAESALKRGFDVKDSSTLIPGHGGFMDRVDGLIAAVVAAAILAAIINAASPARALLFWS